MSHEALIAADCDWIIVGPCGLTLEATVKELPTLLRQPWWYVIYSQEPIQVV
jgi:hypothetical protein